MTDKTGYQGVLDPYGVPIPLLLHDNGDGTYSLSTALAGESGGAVTIAGPLDRKADAQSVSVALSAEDVALLNSIITKLNGGLPAALAAGGGLKVEGVAGGVAQPVNLQPTTSGGSSMYRNLDLGTTGQVVKNASGQLYGYYIYNNASATRFLKLYDKATAPTNSDTPVMTYPIPAGSAANVAFPNGVAFASGISVRATTGIADNDTGAPSTNDVVTNLNYK